MSTTVPRGHRLRQHRWFRVVTGHVLFSARDTYETLLARARCLMQDAMKAIRTTAQIAFFLLTAQAASAVAQTVRVDATPGHAINAFDPDSAWCELQVAGKTLVIAATTQSV